jgi:hypothetical protein
MEHVNYALVLFLQYTVLFGVPAEGMVKQYLYSVLNDHSCWWDGDVCSGGHVLYGLIWVCHSLRFRMTHFCAKT